MAESGFRIVTDLSPQAIAAMKAQALTALEAIGQECEGYAKDDCPVDTGRLRNSLSHKVVKGEYAVYIGSNVEYAKYVEFIERYSHTVGKAHFLRDAAFNHKDHYREILEAALLSNF